MLTFKNVSVRFGRDTVAVDDVSFEVPRGEFCVVLGSSGAGKSTLLRTVNGLVRPAGGGVQVGGMTVTPRNLREVRSRVSMIHQSFNLVPRLTVLTNVLAGALQQVGFAHSLFSLFPKHARRKVCSLLSEVGLTEQYLYRRASNLSGGQQQRVAIARAFILEPAVVLADEPVASLDPKISFMILSLLKEASRRHDTTVLCSLHQVAFAKEFADRIVGMKDGRIVYDGAPGGLSDRILRRIYGDVDVNLVRGDEPPSHRFSAVDEDELETVGAAL
jgi:phosphonate transport system ATP-binding protein